MFFQGATGGKWLVRRIIQTKSLKCSLQNGSKKKKVVQFWNWQGENIFCADFWGVEKISTPRPLVSLFLAGPSRHCCSWRRGGSVGWVGDKRIPGSCGDEWLPKGRGMPLPCEHPIPELMLGSPSRCQSGTALSPSVPPPPRSRVSSPAPGGASSSTWELTENRHRDLGSHPGRAVYCAHQVSASIPEMAVALCLILFL